MLSAEAVLKQRSLFTGKLGESIASPLLTLVDDGRLADGLGSEPWDGEGLPTRRNVLIEGGVLKTYLHNLKTAAEMGVVPTGSASRGTTGNPGVTLFNLFPERGTSSPAELYRQAGNGVLITELMGLHTVDPVSGDLSVGASGIRIREGALAESVDKLTFAGNLMQLLSPQRSRQHQFPVMKPFRVQIQIAQYLTPTPTPTATPTPTPTATSTSSRPTPHPHLHRRQQIKIPTIHRG